MKRLAIVSTHPIQYYAPLFKLLAQGNIVLKVFYTWGEHSLSKFDPGFKRIIKWDIPLLDGYDYHFLTNTAKKPGSNHFWGITNSNAIDEITNFRPDAILVIGWSYRSHLEILRHFKAKIPVWFRGDSTLLDHEGVIKQMLKKVLLKWVYSFIDKAFYVGTNNKEYFQKYGLKSKHLIFAPHAIDNDRFSCQHTEGAEHLRKRLGIHHKEILILFAGKFEKKKDPLLLLNAFKEINNLPAHLLFVGNGELETEMKYVAEQMSNKIHFVDFQNQSMMPIIYQSCDLFCLPSKGPGETWGLAVNEAMAAGKAVLVSNKVGCAEDLVQIGVNGYIFEAGNKPSLIDKLRKLCNIETLERFGKNSERIIRNWTLARTADSFLKELKNEDPRQN